MVPAEDFHWQQQELNDIPFPNLRETETVWRRWCGDRFAPVFRSDFFLEVPAPLAAMGVVVDIDDSGPPYRFRYFGSELARMHTFELTGKTTDAIEPAGFRNICVAQYSTVLRERRPIVFLNDIPTVNPNITAAHIVFRMPFSKDGDTVSQVVSVEEINLDPNEMRRIFVDSMESERTSN